MTNTIEKYISDKFHKRPFIKKILINFSKKEDISEKDIELFYFLFQEKNKKNSGLIIDYNNYSSFSNLLNSFKTFFNLKSNIIFYDLSTNLKEFYLKELNIDYKKQNDIIIIKNNNNNSFEKLKKIFPSSWCINNKKTFNKYIKKYGDFYIFTNKNSFYGLNINENNNRYSCFDINNTLSDKKTYLKILKHILGYKQVIYKTINIFGLNNKINLYLFSFYFISLFSFFSNYHSTIFFTSLFCFFIYHIIKLIDPEFDHLYSISLPKISSYFIIWSLFSGFSFSFDEEYPNPEFIISKTPYIEYNFKYFKNKNSKHVFIEKENILSDNFVNFVYEKSKTSKVFIDENILKKHNIDFSSFEHIEDNKYKGLKYNIYIVDDILGSSKTIKNKEQIIDFIKNKNNQINKLKKIDRLKLINNISMNFSGDDDIKEIIINDLLTDEEKEKIYQDEIRFNLLKL